MTLTEFLEARIAEDEAVARAAQRASGIGPWQASTHRVVVDEGDFEVAEAAVPTAAHIARHDPARVLAECEAKRRIVSLHWSDHECTDGSTYYPGVFAGDPALGMTICPTLRALARVYADHPDFDPAWRLT